MPEITVGTKIPSLELPAINRTTIAQYAKASGDHNPIHLDSQVARQAGLPDIIAHGMLSMAYLGRLLTHWQPQLKLRRFSSQFSAMTYLDDVITCTGTVVELIERDGETLARCEIQAVKSSGETTLAGEALVSL